MFLLSALLACTNQQPDLPEKIEGMWELHQLETKEDGIVDGLGRLLAAYPGCSWGRQTWTFDADHIEAGLDVLCPADEPIPAMAPVEADPAEKGDKAKAGKEPGGKGPGGKGPGAGLSQNEPQNEPMHEFYGCQVTARVPAIWDPEAGSWKVEYKVKSRARTHGRDADAIGVPTECALEIPAGDYQVARVTKQPWRWEMLTPDGAVYRLKLPNSDRPDFVAALRALDATTGNIGGGR